MPINWMKKTFAAAALLTLNGTVAFAQADLKLDVPFSFRANKASMAAGKYTVHPVSGLVSPAYVFRHESGKTALVMATARLTRKVAYGVGQLSFDCIAGDCALKAIYAPFSSTGDRVPTRSNAPPELKSAEVNIPAN